jgi:hypothetical protein
MLVLRVARKTTVWTKTEHRDPSVPEPIFRAGDRVRSAGGTAAADVLIVEDEDGVGTRLVPFSFQPRDVERRWALFGLRLGDENAVELWLRGDRLYDGVPRRAEYRLAVLRPGAVTRVIHNAKNDFSASSGQERTYRWNDFVIEHLGVDAVCAAGERLVPLEQAKILDLREDLL